MIWGVVTFSFVIIAWTVEKLKLPFVGKIQFLFKRSEKLKLNGQAGQD